MYVEPKSMKKLPPASTKASIQNLNGFPTLATVALRRIAIISMVLAISKASVEGGSVFVPFAKSCNFSSQESYCLWTSSIDMQHGYRHAA
jgi:hypothetical protein